MKNWENLYQEEEQGSEQGHLKIFFGYAAGVGKTYAMLKAAHRASAQGIDVVVGYVERHTRQDTLALLNGLEQIPTKKINYRGIELKEFDLDTALNVIRKLFWLTSWRIAMQRAVAMQSNIRM